MALTDRWEEERRAADRRAGSVAAMLYNVNRDRQKDPKGATWEDFFPQWKESSGPQTEDQMLGAMMLWARATKGRGT